jgi:predicted PurR-regulated permease PerM
MIKDTLNFKLLNILILLLIVLILYITKDLWISIYNIVINIIKPIITSIMISYVFNLYLKKLNKYFNKLISVFIFITSIITTIIIFIKLIIKVTEQITDCVNIIYYFLKDILIKYNIDFIDIYNYLEKFTNINILNNIFKYITFIMIVISLSIYTFLNWNKITNKIKFRTNRTTLNYLKNINKEIEKYTTSFFILIIINIIEYALIFLIIGHPNYLLLGLLAGILSIIPIIGGIITNIIAAITAFTLNYKLFIRTLIGILVLSILDGYIVSPLIYSKSNKIHPILIIISLFICSKLLGILGAILAVPLLIIITNIYKRD